MNRDAPPEHLADALEPTSIPELQEALRSHQRVTCFGNGSKPGALLRPEGAVPISLRRITGIQDYHPSEFTFTARAGTPLREVCDALEAHGQHLPFDPPLREAGATLGGTVAAGLSGPGRQRFGGVRDFLIGVRFCDGRGTLLSGGGKVVKNAAGFDFPKLMVGSLGALGVLVELTFKVFPRPTGYATCRFDFATIAEAVAALVKLGRSPFDLEGLELEPPGRLWVRVGGAVEALPARLQNLQSFLGHPAESMTGPGESLVWRAWREFSWRPAGSALVKVPITPGRIQRLDQALSQAGARRLYGAGGSVAWIAWTESAERLPRILEELGLTGLVLFGRNGLASPLLGEVRSLEFFTRLRRVLDPDNRFPALYDSPN